MVPYRSARFARLSPLSLSLSNTVTHTHTHVTHATRAQSHVRSLSSSSPGSAAAAINADRELAAAASSPAHQATIEDLLKGFKARYSLPVQWGEQDSFQHGRFVVFVLFVFLLFVCCSSGCLGFVFVC